MSFVKYYNIIYSMIIIYCNILDDKFPHILYDYAKLNHLNMTQSINNRLVPSSAYTLSNVFMYGYALVIYFFIIKFYSVFDTVDKNLIYAFAILAILILLLILQYKSNLYIQDDKNRDAIYYSSLVSLYDLISKMDIEDIRNNHIKIANIYSSIPNILYDYIVKQISINKNNIFVNICTIVFCVYVLLLIYDIIIVVVYLSSFGAYHKYDHIKHYGIMFVGSTDIQTFEELYKNNPNTKMLSIFNKPISQIYITEQLHNDYSETYHKQQYQLYNIKKTVNNKDYTHMITFEYAPITLNNFLLSMHKYDYKRNTFITHYIKMKKHIPAICDMGQFGPTVQSIQYLKLHPLDHLYVKIFIGLLLIYIALNIYFIKKYKLDSVNNSIISFNNIIQELSKNYSNYVLYSLQNTYYQKQKNILDNIILTETNKIYFKYFLYFNIILIVFFIILLILNRFVPIYSIIYAAYNTITTIIKADENIVIVSEISIFALVMFFIIFLCSLKLYIIILLNNIMYNYMNIINNIDNTQYINNACLVLYNMSNNSVLSQNKHKYNLQGIKNIQYQYNNTVNTINIIPNKLNIISYHSAVNIEDIVVNPIKSRSKLITVQADNNMMINLSQISSRNLYDMFMYSDDNPRILSQTFEDNLWLGIPRKYLTPHVIKNLYDIIPLDKVSETCSAYSSFDNPNAVQYASGGEKQRIAMARIIGRYLVKSNINPNKQFVMCFNDSFAGVDFNTAKFIINKLKILLQFNNVTIIIITNQKEYYMYADNHIYISSDYSLKKEHYY